MTGRAWHEGTSRLLSAAVTAFVVALAILIGPASAAAHAAHRRPDVLLPIALNVHTAPDQSAAAALMVGPDRHEQAWAVDPGPIDDRPSSHGGHDGRPCCAAAGCGSVPFVGVGTPWLLPTTTVSRSPFPWRDRTVDGLTEAPEPKPPRRHV